MRGVVVKRMRRSLREAYNAPCVDYQGEGPQRRLYRKCLKALVKNAKQAYREGAIPWW